MIAYGRGRPITGTLSKGSALFCQKALAEKKQKIKKVESGRKIAKRQMKKTSTTVAKKTRNRTQGGVRGRLLN